MYVAMERDLDAGGVSGVHRERSDRNAIADQVTLGVAVGGLVSFHRDDRYDERVDESDVSELDVEVADVVG
jgi:hypothetical protein